MAESRNAGRGAVAILVGLLLAVVACADSPDTSWREAEGYRWRPLRDAGGREPGFASLAPDRTGIRFVNALSEEALLDNDILANGSGVAIGDYDGDGLADVYLTRIEGANALYRNLGGWRFEEVTDVAGVGLAGGGSRGATWADLDGDGRLDLIVTRHAKPNVFFRNAGGGRFEDRSEVAGFEAALASHSAALADIEGDGDLDLYVTNYRERWARDAFAPAERTFDRVVARDGDRFTVRPAFRSYFRIRETDEGVQRWEFAEPDELYRNDEGRLIRIPISGPAFRDESGRPLDREPDEWGLSVRFTDLDLDGDADLYVCNDLDSPDHIWMNDGEGQFRMVDSLAIRKTSAASMAVAVSDVDRDGWPDLFVAEMLDPDPRARKRQVPETPADPARPGEIGTRPQVKRNTLQMARGDGTWAETAYRAGVAASGWTWGALFLDVDLDGYEDLLTTNGNALDWLDGDARERANTTSGGDAWRRQRLLFPRLETPNLAFRNRGDGTFERLDGSWGFAAGPDISNGLAAGDLDGDGDPDVVVNRLDTDALVLRNDAPGPRVAVELVGPGANTDGIGARVTVEFDGFPVQTAEAIAGGLYLSDSADRMAFAASASTVGRLVVHWPDGRRSAIEDIEAGRLYEVRHPGVTRSATTESAALPTRTEPVATTRSPREGRAPGPGTDPANVPWFEDVGEALGHRHREEIFDEFARQPTIPLRIAQLGPGVSWIDDDRDGDPDLWVGTGRGGRIVRFENRGGRLAQEPESRGAPAPGDVTALIPAPPGLGDVLAGQMSYEAESPAAGIALPSVVSVRGTASVPAVPGAPGTTGPLAAADIDGDGDLDAFVGARAVPTAYPLPVSARFFRNEGGRLVEDALNADVVRGLASAAVFSDVDVDGDPDLLVAMEWGPVRLYENRGGRFSDATAAHGLADRPGRWNGIATGDLNEDGLPDIVATAWGDNTIAQLDEAGREILYGDLDRNGVFDVVELERGAGDELRPALRLDQLGEGLPFLRRIAPDHRAYAAADLETLLTTPVLAGARRATAVELRHIMWLSGKDGFRPRPLPPLAQVAPAFGVAVADLDGDGHEDVVLAQNFFANRLSLPRYDAGRGVILRGDGTGELEAVPGQRSGFLVYGDGRGLALGDYDLDGRPDVAVGQNGGPTRLFRNRSATPGIRVRLLGPASNPRAIGAAVRLEHEGGLGPLRELQAGSGYWSQNELAPILGAPAGARAVRIRWPGGEETRLALASGQTEVEVVAPGGPP